VRTDESGASDIYFAAAKQLETSDMTLLELIEPQYGVKPAEVHYLEGVLQYHGLGVPQDFATAFTHCEVAANAGLPAAQYLAGRMLIEGTGVAQDTIAGLTHLRHAADQKFVLAILWLALLLSQTEPDSPEVFKLNEMAANLGVPLAAYALAVAFEEGRVVTKSNLDALRWYEKAASLGYCFASQRLVIAYTEGQLDLEADKVMAQQWTERAEAQQEHMEAEEFGCIEVAATNGHEASQLLLAMIFRLGTHGKTVDLAKSKYWEERRESKVPGPK
jgi:TPR repeat protein